MSRIRADKIVNGAGTGAPSFPKGIILSGVSTITADITSADISAENATFSGIITSASLSVSGNVSVGGTLTYEDVTSIDSVGVITARSGIHVTGTGSNGRLGIGTNNPGEQLHILSNATSEIKLETTGPYSPSTIQFKGPSNGRIDFRATTGDAAGRILYSHVTDSLTFSTKQPGGNRTDRVAITSEGFLTKPYHPCFDANLSSGAVTAGAESATPVIYNSTSVNNGNYYNTSNGRFTAPVAGIYQFWWGCIKNNLTTVVVRSQLEKNGTTYLNNGRQLRMDASSAGVAAYGDNGAITLITSLAKDDYVRVMVTAGVMYGGGANYTYFCGNLIG
tara:strand:+ start:24 stop:1025 length:1002 start_codon:yes stop_codon:yes gene_type:complete